MEKRFNFHWTRVLHDCTTHRLVSLRIRQRSVRPVEIGQFITRLVSGFSQTNKHRWDLMKSGHLKRDRCTNIVRGPPDGMETLLLLPRSTMGEKSKKHCQNQKSVSVGILFVFFFSKAGNCVDTKSVKTKSKILLNLEYNNKACQWPFIFFTTFCAVCTRTRFKEFYNSIKINKQKKSY